MTAILFLGFLLGLRHALEGDHVAAVAALVARNPSPRRTILQGAFWGLGHALTLFVACTLVLFLDALIPERVAHWLEAAAGLMLVALGIDLLRKLWRDRVHFHVHEHDDGTVHLHAHSHRGEPGTHDVSPHRHAHTPRFPLRAFGVGMMHGLAGSAALLLLTAGTGLSAAEAMVYVALFGLGATAGMALLTVAIAVPLSRSAASMTRLGGALQVTVACATLGLGLTLLIGNATAF